MDDVWPLFDLGVTTADVTLRHPDDDMLVEMVAVAAEGVHDPDVMPFLVPWTRHDSPTLEREALRFHWRCRADTRPDDFRIALAVVVDERIVGASEIAAKDFGVLRRFTTGSWLGRRFQGRGLGTATRRATLALGFDGLGARWAQTQAWSDNAASIGVTRSLGYVGTGRRGAASDGRPRELVEFEMGVDHFDAHVRPEGCRLHGVEPVRRFLEID